MLDYLISFDDPRELNNLPESSARSFAIEQTPVVRSCELLLNWFACNIP